MECVCQELGERNRIDDKAFLKEVLEFIRNEKVTSAKLALLCQYLQKEQMRTNVTERVEQRGRFNKAKMLLPFTAELIQ